MGRKKKEELEIHHTPFGSTLVPPEYDLSPYSTKPNTIEVTSLGDTYRRYITTTDPGVSLTYTGTGDARTVYYPPKPWQLDYEDFMKQIGKEEETKVEINKSLSSDKNVVGFTCKNKEDLKPENILTTISAVKSRLIYETSFVFVKETICNMTPQVKNNLIIASKRLRMYGKQTPIIPCFDEYGNRLPDKIKIDTDHGMTLNIVDPDMHGELYFELRANVLRSPVFDGYAPSVSTDSFYKL